MSAGAVAGIVAALFAVAWVLDRMEAWKWKSGR